MSLALGQVKWLARVINRNGGWGRSKRPIPAEIRIVLERKYVARDFMRAIRTLTTGGEPILVSRAVNGTYTLRLKGPKADAWIQLAWPYLSMDARL